MLNNANRTNLSLAVALPGFLAFAGAVALAAGVLGAALALPACSSEPTKQKQPRGPCPPGTKLVEGRHCVVDRPYCPEGLEYNDAGKFCYFPCHDAAVDGQVSPYCTAEASVIDVAR
jgi:hypothetical protein